jgi:hypothetical protein
MFSEVIKVKTTTARPLNDVAPAIQEVERIHAFAKQVNATAIVTFLTGLQNFLTLLSQRPLVLASKKLKTVEDRINAVVAMAQEWADVGREERDAIERLIATSD